jgi:putative ABC transport system permease protein
MAAFLLILLYVQHELSYDGYHQYSDRIFRIAMEGHWGGRDFDVTVVPPVTAKTMIADYPEVEEAVRFRQHGSHIVQYKDRSFREQRVIFTDTTFFKLFSIPLLRGNIESVLSAPYSIALSRKTAEKYFRDENPLGKTLKLENSQDYNVTGVFEEIPDNTHFHFDILLSLESLEESRDPTWLRQNFVTYLLLSQDTDPTALEAKFPQMLEKYMWPQFAKVLGKPATERMSVKLYLQPLKSIHLHSDLVAELEPNSDIRYIYIFATIALFILIIASINFMNLATARASGRAKEVGVRKVLGSQRRQLILQHLIESILFSLLSMILAIGVVSLALKAFNQISGKSMDISNIFFHGMPLYLILVAVFTGFLAGSYPAFFISAFQPIQVLKRRTKISLESGSLRGALVVFQFTASIILIIGTIVVFKQLRYIQNKNLGFDKEQVLILDNAYLLGNEAKSFKDIMKTYPQFVNGSISGYLPVPSIRSNALVLPEGDLDDEHSASFQAWSVDYDYLDTMGMKIVQGRFFSQQFSTDDKAAVINQATAKQFNWSDPVGRRLGLGFDPNSDVELYKVIGVVEDFHFESLRENIGPLVMYLGNQRDNISFRLKTQDIAAAIGLLESQWKEFLPNQPFEYSFLDELFEQMYRAEQKIGKIFAVFASLAIFISCLGSFGLAAFTAEQRTKEIGIRKVLGASVARILFLLSTGYAKWIIFANLISWPIAYYAMSRWLQNFAYRTDINIWIFILSGAIALLIALLSVSYQSIKAATANPVDSLRYE